MKPVIPPDATTLGVGVDLVDVDRIRKSRENHGSYFLEKVFTEEEREYCLGMSDPDPHLAARFAAKEAVAKAFGTGIGKDVGWRSISVSREASGAPLVILDDKAKAKLKALGGTQVLLSLSHLTNLAAAFAVITR
ncbi:MAG: holo-ACP synthase [Opitutales bacterium]